MSVETLKILVVDDDAIDRVVYQRLLSQNTNYDIKFTEAESGREGLEILKKEKPDCILLDYCLPDIDGLEFLIALDEDEACNKAPAVMLTGQGNEKVAVDAMKYGVKDYIVKANLNSAELFRAVNNAIEKAELTQKIKRKSQEFRKFASIAAYDLNEPLEKVQHYCEKIQSNPRAELDKDTLEYLELISENVASMKELVQALIAYTSTERNEQPLVAKNI